MKNDLWKGFEVKLILIIFFIAIALSVCFYAIIYSQYYKLTIDDLKDHARIVHQYAEEVISDDSFAQLNTVDDEAKEIYLATHEQLDTIRRLGNIRYLYTAKKNERGEYIYVLDGLDPAAADFRHIGDLIEEDIRPSLDKCLGGEVVLGDRIMVTDWGIVYVTYFPVHDHAGKVIGAIGMEFDCEGLYHAFSRVRSLTLGIGSLITILCATVAIAILKKVVGKTEATLRKKDEDLSANNLELRQSSLELQAKERLLRALNDVAGLLLSTMEQERVDAAIQEAIGIMGNSTGIDRVYIWRNKMEDGELHYVCDYEWKSDIGQQITTFLPGAPVHLRVKYAYSRYPAWMRALSGGFIVNGPLSEQSRDIRELLEPYGVRSILAIPIHFQDNFWGFITFDDCHREYAFENRDVDILKSGSLMVASILERNEYAARLESALREAHDANRAKSDFLARMSHEMRTPLNAIIGLSEVALGAGGISNSETHSNFSNIHSAGMTLLATVNDILDISKIAANKIELVPREYGLTDLLHDVTTQGTTFLGEKPVKFVLDVDESLPARLCGDELRVKQIVNNLLSNACKFTEEGVVELSVSALREGDAVWLTCRVRDTGIGIRSQDLGNLFTDYTRLDAAATGKITGTGLGLSITRRLSELMGGGVTVESEYGKGSTFTVRIRQGFVDEETIGPDIAARLQNFSYGTTKRRRDSRFVRCKLPYARVLVVDDVRMNLAVAKGLLKPYEMQIDCVSGGQEAIDAIRGENVRYDAVFMDHMMPGIDGIEATRIIREEIGTEYAQTIPIIALTANALVGNDELFLSKGFQAFLSKPIDALRLDAIVMQWIRDEKREKQVPDGGGDGRG